MKKIELTRGKFALVDDDLFDFLNQWKWHAKPGSSRKNNSNTFYAVRTHRKDGVQKNIYMHRVVLGLTDNKLVCDHKDRDSLNNQKENLRISDFSGNASNRSSLVGSSSKFLGVTKLTDKRYKIIKYYWVAQIRKHRKLMFILRCPYTEQGEIDAAKAYDEKAKELHGEFANLNFKT